MNLCHIRHILYFVVDISGGHKSKETEYLVEFKVRSNAPHQRRSVRVAGTASVCMRLLCGSSPLSK